MERATGMSMRDAVEFISALRNKKLYRVDVSLVMFLESQAGGIRW